MRIVCAILVTAILSCTKESKEPTCQTWRVMYWQGKSDRTTVTANYLPYTKEEEICGAGKDTVSRNKTTILIQVGPDLFNYKTFEIQLK